MGQGPREMTAATEGHRPCADLLRAATQRAEQAEVERDLARSQVARVEALVQSVADWGFLGTPATCQRKVREALAGEKEPAVPWRPQSTNEEEIA